MAPSHTQCNGEAPRPQSPALLTSLGQRPQHALSAPPECSSLATWCRHGGRGPMLHRVRRSVCSLHRPWWHSHGRPRCQHAHQGLCCLQTHQAVRRLLTSELPAETPGSPPIAGTRIEIEVGSQTAASPARPANHQTVRRLLTSCLLKSLAPTQ